MPENAYRKAHLHSHYAAGVLACRERYALEQGSPPHHAQPCQVMCLRCGRVTARRDVDGWAWCGGSLPQRGHSADISTLSVATSSTNR